MPKITHPMPNSRLRVHLLEEREAESLAALQAALDPGVVITSGTDAAAAAPFDVLVGGRPKAHHLDASPSLRALVVPWAGVPEPTRELLRRYPHVSLHNLHYNAITTAETAVALLLAAAKALVPADRALRQHDWRIRYASTSPSVRLHGATALVLGYGAIGRNVGRMCAGLGMRVLGVRRRAPDGAEGTTHDGVAQVYGLERLSDLLPEAQALMVCLPITASTRGLVGARELALLPRGALLVNVGRGEVVDEAALYEALRSRHLHAAGIDVWYNYPTDEASRANTPPSRFPFWELDNVVMSPHRAALVADSEQERMRALAALLNTAARGEPMPNRVDLDAGY